MNLPAVSQTPKGSRGNDARSIASKFKNSSHPNLHGHAQPTGTYHHSNHTTRLHHTKIRQSRGQNGRNERMPPSIPPPPPPGDPPDATVNQFMQQITPRLHVNSMSAVSTSSNTKIPPPPSSPPPDLPASHQKHQKRHGNQHGKKNQMTYPPKQKSYNEPPIPMYTKQEPDRPLPHPQLFLSSPNLSQPPDLSK